MRIQETLNKGVKSSDLIKIKLSHSQSHIIKENGGIIYCSVYKGLKGLFKKDIKETEEFGRKICDEVKERLKNRGFFTSDELPNYGINEEETKIILERTKAGNEDLVVIFVYNKRESQKTKDFLDGTLRQASD